MTEKEKFEKVVESANNEADDRFLALAEYFRCQHLIPFCRKHRLTFLSGMGTWFFVREDGKHISPMYTPEEEWPEGIEEIDGMLELELCTRPVGTFVNDIVKEEW